MWIVGRIRPAAGALPSWYGMDPRLKPEDDEVKALCLGR
jgi:hypothetical protein